MSEIVRDIIVLAGEEDRLDKILAVHFPEHSRSRLQNLIKNGFVTVDDKIILKTGTPLFEGNHLNIRIPEVKDVGLLAEDIPLDIIFENADVAVINKAAGMVVHPAAGHMTGTLVHAAMSNFEDLEGIGGEMRPGIVHRLDKDTSGLILIAKNESSHRWLQDQFRLRKVHKTYLALVDGKPPTPAGRIEAAIARDPSHRKKMAVVSEGRGRASVTEYKTVRAYENHTLLEAYPLTGRTHQIRLHMAFLNCPIAGDTIYGHKHPTLNIQRHFLHAAKISVILPDEKTERIFEAPLPDELQEALNNLK